MRLTKSFNTRRSYPGTLKLDIEGTEYEVLDSLLDDSLALEIPYVEFDQPVPFRQTLAAPRRLRSTGYELVSVGGWNCAFFPKPEKGGVLRLTRSGNL